MLKRLLIISIGVFLLFSRGYAAGGTVEGVDSTVWVSLDGDTAAVIVYDQPVAVADTSSSFSERKEKESVIVRRERNFDPSKAAWYAAVCPGLGQIYNRQYWKLPLVYGGFVGLGYAVSRMDAQYAAYHKAYVHVTDSDPNTTGYTEVMYGIELTDTNRDYYTRVFKNYQDNYRRYRDLCIAAVGVWYLLTVLDAYVDAHMRDYDISPDLSFKIGPSVLPPSPNHETETALGVKCKFSIK